MASIPYHTDACLILSRDIDVIYKFRIGHIATAEFVLDNTLLQYFKFQLRENSGLRAALVLSHEISNAHTKNCTQKRISEWQLLSRWAALISIFDFAWILEFHSHYWNTLQHGRFYEDRHLLSAFSFRLRSPAIAFISPVLHTVSAGFLKYEDVLISSFLLRFSSRAVPPISALWPIILLTAMIAIRRRFRCWGHY